jgi:hypothetical protein
MSNPSIIAGGNCSRPLPRGVTRAALRSSRPHRIHEEVDEVILRPSSAQIGRQK